MSESSYNLTAFTRRQPTYRRLVKSKVQKQGQNKVKTSQQQRASYKGVPIKRLKVSQDVVAAPQQSLQGREPTHGAAFTKRPRVVAPLGNPPKLVSSPIKPRSKGKIPPFKPTGVKLNTVRMRKRPLLKKNSPSRRTRLKPMARTILYALRLLIVGVGIGAIVGTLLSVLDPATRITTPEGAASNTIGPSQSPPTSNPPVASGLFLSQEIVPLKTTVQNLAAANPNLTPGVFLFDLENGGYVDVNGSAIFSAASTIKIPILVAFFQDVDALKIRLDEKLAMQKEMVAGGSGDMQYQPVGTQFSALEVATKMMTVSDNTATNMLIARMGGVEALNQRFRSWGLTTTAIRNQLPDLEGTNTTSPRDLGNVMAMVSKGNLVSLPSRDRLLDIMRRTVRNHLLPTGLEPGATIAHKTGDIGTTLADAGLVDMPTGKRYIIAVMIQRPNNDPRAEKLISSISRAAYQQFSQTAPVAPGTGSTTPSSYQSPAINPPVPNGTGSTIPTTGYQPPMMSPPVPNSMGSTMPTTSYQPPIMNPPIPNGMGSTMPTTSYQQSPVMNPQYYNPYQR